MQIYVLFGLPGTGKTFVGKILQNHFGYYLYEADQDLPPDMDHAIQNQLQVTDKMRDKFFNKIIQKTKILITKHEKFAVSQTFIKEKYRRQFHSEFPSAKFILIKTKKGIRENRLLNRKEYPLDLEYSRKMVQNFDAPKRNHEIIQNDLNGEVNIINQLKEFLK